MHIRTSPRRCCAALAGAVALALATSPVLAAGNSPVPAAFPAATPAAAAPAVGPLVPLVPAGAPAPIVCGLVAFLDPDTGLLTGPISWLTPPVDQVHAAAPVLLEEFPLPGGGWAMDLKGTLMESYVMHLDAFGHRTVQCVPAAQATAIAGGKGN